MPIPRISLEQGDLTKVTADAIVNAANSSLLGGGGVDGAELLAACHRNALRVADELGASTVAFPAISTGIYGWPLPDAARIALGTVAATDCAVVREVRFLLFGDATYKHFASYSETL